MVPSGPEDTLDAVAPRLLGALPAQLILGCFQQDPTVVPSPQPDLEVDW